MPRTISQGLVYWECLNENRLRSLCIIPLFRREAVWAILFKRLSIAGDRAAGRLTRASSSTPWEGPPLALHLPPTDHSINTTQPQSSRMAKGKSSASSATRKKHAAKAAKGSNADDVAEAQASTKPQQPAQRGQKKVKKDRFAPKIKSYVPPPPPPRGAPDPVDLYLNGGAGVDAELVVVLRRLAKRDEATLQRGVDGLEGWVREVVREEGALGRKGEEGWKVEQRREELVTALAVWVSTLRLR